MIRRVTLLVLAGAAAGCGNVPTTADGVATLEVIPPAVTTFPVGDTVRFSARTLDPAGNPLEVAVSWRTPDTTITVEPTSGIVVGKFPGIGRVQAVVGTDELVSNFTQLTIQEPPTPPPE